MGCAAEFELFDLWNNYICTYLLYIEFETSTTTITCLCSPLPGLSSLPSHFHLQRLLLLLARPIAQAGATIIVLLDKEQGRPSVEEVEPTFSNEPWAMEQLQIWDIALRGPISSDQGLGGRDHRWVTHSIMVAWCGPRPQHASRCLPPFWLDPRPQAKERTTCPTCLFSTSLIWSCYSVPLVR